MPKVSSKEKYLKRYTEDDITKAVEAVRSGLAKKTASKKFGVPRATIQFRMSSAFVKAKPGPPTALTKDEESTLVEWIITSARKGFPKRKEDLMASVEQFLKDKPRSTKLVQNKPGEGWYKLFLKRHPEVTLRTAEAVTSASANVSEGNVRKWFEQVENYLNENDFKSIMEDPKRVYNGDETNFQLCPKNSKVLAPRGAKDVYEIDNAVAKSCLTVMFTFSASGDITPPLIIYPLKRMRADIRSSVPSSWGVGLSDNGWMNKELFHQYIQNVLYPHLLKEGIQFPVILFVDGHKSHINYHLSKTCEQYGIILIALYPNATRILQPADVAAFKPMKNAWRKGVLEWRRNNITKNLTKVDFAPILDLVLKNHIKKETLVNGFRTCGLCPWNPDAINYAKCLGKNTNSQHLQRLEPESISITLPQFEKIVGPTIISHLEDSSQIQDNCFKALLKVYQTLKGVNHNEYNFSQEDNNESIDDIHLPSNNDDWMNLPFEIEDFDTVEGTQAIGAINMLDVSEAFSLSVTGKDKSQEHELNQVTNTQDSQLSEVLNVASTIKNADNQDISNETPNKVEIPRQVSTIEESSNLVEPKTPIKDMRSSLSWPKTPVRKGKQVNLKPLYVLTSAEWLKQEKDKLEVKEKIETEKIQRKRKREENKANKAKQVKKKKEQSGKNKGKDEIENNIPLSIYKKSSNYCAENNKTNDGNDLSTEGNTLDKIYKEKNVKKIRTVKKEISQYIRDQDHETETECIESAEIGGILTDRMEKHTPIKKLTIKKNMLTPVKLISIKNMLTPVKLIKTKDSENERQKPKIITNEVITTLPKQKLMEFKESQEVEKTQTQTVHSGKYSQEFILPKPMKKMYERRETFRNEEELTEFLNKMIKDDTDSDDIK